MSTRDSPAPPPERSPQQARVQTTHGRLLRLLFADGRDAAAHPPGRRLSLVCGDLVDVVRDERHGEWRITGLQPRRGCLYRSNQRGRAELLAANLDLLVVVVAPQPAVDLYMVDRYLAAAESGGLAACIVLNKTDLPEADAAIAQLAGYGALGYPVLGCSALLASGGQPLSARLAGHAAMLVGQSGVGKSSLVGALLPHVQPAVGELAGDSEGRHTTTTTCWYPLAGGGALLDSPGVRDFAPAVERLRDGDLGFRDIAQFARNCRFADCRHWREPGCAVRSAAVDGWLDERRLESYRRLWRLREQLRARLGPGQSGARRD